MKKIIKIWLLCSLSNVALSQTGTSNRRLDSLRLNINQSINDTTKMASLFTISSYFIESNRDSSLIFAEQAIPISKKLNQPLWFANLLLNKAFVVGQRGNLPLSFNLINEALAIAKDEKNEKNVYVEKSGEVSGDPHKYRLNTLAAALHHLGNSYSAAGNKEKAIVYFKEEARISESVQFKVGMVTSILAIGNIYSGLDKLDSAQRYLNEALVKVKATGYNIYEGNILEAMGTIYFKRKQTDSARQYYSKSLTVHRKHINLAGVANANISFARLYESMRQADSMMYYAKAALYTASNLKAAPRIRIATQLVSGAYKMQGNIDSAFAYLAISKALGDSLNDDRNEKLTQFQNINFDEQMRLQKAEGENIAYKNKIRTWALIGGLGALALVAIAFYRNNRQKQKVNTALQSQKQEIENTLAQLQSTQSQLIQSEKMASLGELTAGIAHEIQNPLNFVNNFSEVNKELIEEAYQANETGNSNEVKELLSILKGNEEKVNHHGKRADAIVKGMLQHSRSSAGVKDAIDINALADEYLRLAYHGLRAKDNSFNATMNTDFDNAIGKVNIVPQDIGRVLLNLYNNAFYAVREKKNTTTGAAPNEKVYEPTVSINTKKTGNKVVITVTDNGNGIPSKVVDKIFQPFFTTKPTGQGTGLGLSLSYDIVKAHGGEIKVNTTEGAFTEFVVQLPI